MAWTSFPGNVPCPTHLRQPGRRRGAALTVRYSLPPIRVCLGTIDPCTPVDGAEVYDLTYYGYQYPTASGGLVQDDGIIRLGDELWVKYLDEPLRHDLGLYCTSAQPVTVTAAGFQIYAE